ncbi:MAG: hypothetical protein JRI80_17445 [Deltaproteobacteria bacterium]|nr:hypothetical protein [Deltaproteobacteria bacterium]
MLFENWIREMGWRALVLEAHHTTHIEDIRLTLDKLEFKKPMDYTTHFCELGESATQ